MGGPSDGLLRHGVLARPEMESSDVTATALALSGLCAEFQRGFFMYCLRQEKTSSGIRKGCCCKKCANRESNPGQVHGKHLCYRYTIGAGIRG